MKKSAFVCFGSDRGRDPLVYQEIPRRESGEEFFVLFSPGSGPHEGLLRELFRDTISASRLGHPSSYFIGFLNRFESLVRTMDRAEDILSSVTVTVMIRRDEEIYLLSNRSTEVIHWDALSGRAEALHSYPGVTEISLKKEKEQGDLFEQSLEDLFALRKFKVREGNHTLLMVPSKEFFARFGEQFKNSVFFPSFQIPEDSGIDLETTRTLAAMHWDTTNGAAETKEVPLRMQQEKRKKIPLPIMVGVPTLVIMLIILFSPRGEKRPVIDVEGQAPLLAVQGGGEEEQGSPEAVVEESRTQASVISLEEAWKKVFDHPVTSSPAHCGGRIFFGCRNGSLYAYSTEGEMLWQYKSGDGIGASPFCSGDRVISANYRGDVFCLDGKTGGKTWSFAARDKIVSSPQIRGDLVVVGTMEGNLIALGLKDGSRRWAKKIGESIWANPTVGKDYVIAATTDGSLVKLDHAGKIIWTAKPGGGIRSTPACMDEHDLVVFGTKDNYLYAYSLSAGNLMWRHLFGGEINAPPISNGSEILVGCDDGNLYALNMSGQRLWRRSLGGTVLSKPYIMGGLALVTSYSSKIFAIDIASGEIKSEFSASSPIYSSPLVTGNRVYFGSNAGIFYSLRIHGGSG
jgi:outer membrane protein assembly factor BamB